MGKFLWMWALNIASKGMGSLLHALLWNRNADCTDVITSLLIQSTGKEPWSYFSMDLRGHLIMEVEQVTDL